MIEAFKIAANLTITGDANKKMLDFTKNVNKASKELQIMLKSLKAINVALNAMGLNLDKINPRLLKLAESVFNLGGGLRQVNRSFNYLNESLGIADGRTQRLKFQMDTLRSSLRGVSAASTQARASLVGMPTGRMRGSARSGGGGGAGAGAGFLGGVAGRLGVGGAVGGAFAAFGLGKAGFNSALSYEQQMSQLTSQNIPGLNEGSVNSFISNSNRGSISKLSMLEGITDAASITKNARASEIIGPLLARYKLNMESMYPGHQFSNAQLQSAIKVAEITSGSNDPNVLAPYIERMFKTSLSTGLRVQPSTYLAATKTMRGYAKGMDPDFFFYMLEPLFQEYGTKVGPMISQFYQHMRVGRLTTQGAQMLGKMGLVNPKDVNYDKAGRIKGINPGGIVGSSLMGKNIFDWVDNYLVPAFSKVGANTPDQQMNILGKIFTNSDLTLVNTYLQQRGKIRSNYAANLKTAGMGDVTASNANRLNGVNKNFSEAWNDFTNSIGEITKPGEIQGLKLLTTFFEYLSKVIDNMPRINGQTLLNAGLQMVPGGLAIKAGTSLGSKLGTALSSAFSGSDKPMQAHFYLDSNRVATITASAMTKAANTQTSMGQSGHNMSVIPTSNTIGFNSGSYSP